LNRQKKDDYRQQVMPDTVRHLWPPQVHNLNHSYTKPTVACSITHSASNSSSEVHSNAVCGRADLKDSSSKSKH